MIGTLKNIGKYRNAGRPVALTLCVRTLHTANINHMCLATVRTCTVNVHTCTVNINHMCLATVRTCTVNVRTCTVNINNLMIIHRARARLITVECAC